MPWYRVNGMPVHIKLAGKAKRNPPKPCAARIPSNEPGKVDMRCCGISTLLCDHQLDDGTTCDAPLCAEHAVEIGPDKHLCPRHAAKRGGS